MKTNNDQGRLFTLGITVYLIIKVILNGIIGGYFDIGGIIVALIFGAAMFTGLKYVNYAVAVYLVLIAVIHLPTNIAHISSNWVYLLEGIIDIGCAAALCFFPPIKEHFTNGWNDVFGKRS